ncbi:MAG: rRNA maturation RNase YbeY [Cyclobacteriaceae bacterium]|nr:rRNA maturation RNase YbeY [Cyclobacteriaceae bacterium]
MANITFQNEDVHFILPDKTKIKKWIEKIILQENSKKHIQISFIFCSDSFLHQINKTYLQHDSLTDIITFNYSEDEDTVESDIFISIDRVGENSKLFKTPFIAELQRVMIHGVLHLLGFKDKTKDQREKMREKENECLTLYHG